LGLAPQYLHIFLLINHKFSQGFFHQDAFQPPPGRY
jgi:hypothetical protein